MHLQDCTQRAQLDMRSNLNEMELTVNCIQTLSPRQPPYSTHCGIMSQRKADTEFIIQKLENAYKDIVNSRTEVGMPRNSGLRLEGCPFPPIELTIVQIENHIGLKTRSNKLLTFLAAVYIPLAFVTVRYDPSPCALRRVLLNVIQSFLGMNIASFSTVFTPSPSSTPNPPSLSSMSSTLPTPANHSADPTATNIGPAGPNPQVWDLRWFGILSGPLLFVTIILPLIIGPTIRCLLKSYIRSRRTWNTFLIITLLMSSILLLKGVLRHVMASLLVSVTLFGVTLNTIHEGMT